jgi:hypothetical protein
MRFGIREICDVVFKPLTPVDFGKQHFDKGQPCLTIDTAKTSTIESAVTTVYAQGGKGNPRLIGWDGEKTITFTVEDALLSEQSFAMLSGCGIADALPSKPLYVHTTATTVISGTAQAPKAIIEGVDTNASVFISAAAPMYATILNSAGAAEGYLPAITAAEVTRSGSEVTVTFAGDRLTEAAEYLNSSITFDFYLKYEDHVKEMAITPDKFAGYYYIEASTLFRDEETGTDLPAELIIPRGKIQSNFTLSMANTGDPSTFTFTIDAFPGYTKFDKTQKVQFVLQVVDTANAGTHDYSDTTINEHTANEPWDTSMSSATASIYTGDTELPAVTYTYTAVQNPTGNPHTQGYYERSGTSPNYVYTLSADTTVNESKTYYTRSVAAG